MMEGVPIHEDATDNKEEEEEGKCRRGDFVAIAPDGDDPFWLAQLEEDIPPTFLNNNNKNNRMVSIRWIDPDPGHLTMHSRNNRQRAKILNTYHLGDRDRVSV